MSAALPIAAALILVGMLVAMAFLIPKKVSLSNQASERHCFLTAAESTMDGLVNVNADNLEEQMQMIEDGATGDFQKQVDSIREQQAALVNESQAASVGHVLASAVQDNDDESATVLVLATGTVTNANAEGPMEQSWRGFLTVEKADGVCKTAKAEWKVA